MLKYFLIPVDLALLAWFVFHMMTPMSMWPLVDGSCRMYYETNVMGEFIRDVCYSDTVVDGLPYTKVEQRTIDENGEELFPFIVKDLIRYKAGVYYSNRSNGEVPVLFDNLYLGRKWDNHPYSVFQGIDDLESYEVVSVNDTLTTPSAFYENVTVVAQTVSDFVYHPSPAVSDFRPGLVRRMYYVHGKGCVAIRNGNRFTTYMVELTVPERR